MFNHFNEQNKALKRVASLAKTALESCAQPEVVELLESIVSAAEIASPPETRTVTTPYRRAVNEMFT